MNELIKCVYSVVNQCGLQLHGVEVVILMLIEITHTVGCICMYSTRVGQMYM